MFTIEDIKKQILEHHKKIRLVFPEGVESKIIEVATRIQKEGLADVNLLFNGSFEVPKDLDPGLKYTVVKESLNEDMLQRILEIRKGRLEVHDAVVLVQKRNYYGALLIDMDLADAMVCGLNYTTADTLRAALQIVKTSENYSIASSIFIMHKGEEDYIFTDCALNVDPDSKNLADIAYMAARFALKLNVKNVEVAMLSYSTAGSGSGPTVDKVKKAVDRLKGMEDDTNGFLFDGEMQFDSAFIKAVRDKKYPNSRITKEKPDVFVFPDLNAGNIGYKIAQRLGGFEAIGPFILGLRKPVNDLSRGATVEDIYKTSVVTIYQAIMKGAK
ncbi:phosphate acetyltransferase [Spiroplasma tabanidicola]|uniref:Phosphate acetyltransferase n=1 Tax=Spiroplasma tabanidicola TaxID=324079 RepID=A0A6I6C5Z4_9MOLU|nr:phosphate acetyltransferase [Spiroplasma tabanidicola]QGS52327.1 phosphotransacetylase [Spiroplasma tabanidicola]